MPALPRAPSLLSVLLSSPPAPRCGGPGRLRLVSLIGAHQGGQVCVCELGTAFSLTQPAISHHLKVLREAGIIDSERRGTWVYYWLVPATLARISALPAPPAR